MMIALKPWKIHFKCFLFSLLVCCQVWVLSRIKDYFLYRFQIFILQYFSWRVFEELKYWPFERIIFWSISKLQTPLLGTATFNAFDEKSTIFGQISWNFQELTHQWCGQSLKVWAKLVKNCGFFINSIEKCNS